MKSEILVPLDGSRFAEQAIPHAEALARAASCGITLLRVVEPLYVTQPMLAALPVSDAAAGVWQDESSLAGEYLSNVAAHLRGKGFDVRTERVEGDPATCIIAYARDNAGITAIAMSTHGRRGLGRWLLGSVSEKVLHAAPRPLLLVRSKEPSRPQENGERSWPDEEIVYNKILVPLDGSPFAEQGLDAARSLAKQTGATLILNAVVEPASAWLPPEETDVPLWAANKEQEEARSLYFYLENMAARLADEGIKAGTQRTWGDPAEEIVRTGQEQADLIVMSTHGRSGLQRLWLGSVAVKVVRNTSLPVLLVRARNPEEVAAAPHRQVPESALK